MVDYVESFSITGRTFGISKEADNRFTVWVGGCSIGSFISIIVARENAHRYAISQLTAEARGYRERMEAAENALERLGNDPFNLGRFRIK